METKRAWGVERTWPDGHSEIQEYSNRHFAESQAESYDGADWTGEVVYQDITKTDWRYASAGTLDELAHGE